ncbi:MAG: C-terminal helicase domain-containing protein [Lysobacterales bacterium]
MLRAVVGGQPWSQAKIPDREWKAVEVAHLQLGLRWPLSRVEIDARLESQYVQLESRRGRFRDRLLERLEAGFRARPEGSVERTLFDSFANAAGQSGNDDLVRVARSLQSALGNESDGASDKHLAEAFCELIGALRSRDEGDEDSSGELEESEARALWPILAARLADEYSRVEGDFARLMHGETKPETRRLLQLAFNRVHSNPQVLVAQSMVGREGLNLHRACRHVLLLHPEWNPGVVEQQIGRIDRVGSRWEQQCRSAIEAGALGESLPRIEILPVVFKGTYDEQNWCVLRERWGDLRAQLHGIVVTQWQKSAYGHLGGVIEEINAAAPSFSPLRRDRQRGG